jgi:hypothetical protein
MLRKKKLLLELLCCGGLKRAFGGCLKRTFGGGCLKRLEGVLFEVDLKGCCA